MSATMKAGRLIEILPFRLLLLFLVFFWDRDNDRFGCCWTPQPHTQGPVAVSKAMKGYGSDDSETDVGNKTTGFDGNWRVKMDGRPRLSSQAEDIG